MSRTTHNPSQEGTSESSKPTDLRTGSILGRYELLLPIAKGGMAQVWAARLRGTRGFQKLVAIKTILANAIDSTRLEQMFLEEAQLASQIHHANVVATHDLGDHDGTLYLVMEWVDGEPLSEIITRAGRQGGIPLPIGVNLIGQACKGLHAAHTLRDESGSALGVVHRDVSPQNLLVTLLGTAKLVDFGIAKVTSKASHLTEAGEVKGKFSYMAPEQIAGQAVDCRADLFALGIILYYVTTGKHPFRGENPAETIKNICSESKPLAPSSVVADYPSALEAVVLKALEKSPAARFESAHQMLEALEAAMPDPLEPSFDVKVGEYMHALVGKRAAERRGAIRVAQEHADRMRPDSTSISSGTLRAVAFDRNEITPISSPRSAPMEPRESITPAPFRPKRARWVAPAAGVALAASLLAVTLFMRRAPDAPSASSPVPAVSPPAAMPAAQAPASETAETVSPTPSAEAADDSGADAPAASSDARKSRARNAARAAALKPRPAAETPASVTAPAPPAPAPQGASAPAANAPPSANAWDRQTFGGRF
ncbi:MAG TPA: serine/threonine-protein kinase [Polyangiaceae bacterium]